MVVKLGKSLPVKPKIRGTGVASLEVRGIQLSLKRKLSLSNLRKLVEATDLFLAYIDVEKLCKSIAEVKEEEKDPPE